MWRRGRWFAGLILSFLMLIHQGAWGETLVVKSLTAKVKASPSLASATLLDLSRGDKVEAVKKEGNWYMVSIPGTRTRGWIFSFSVEPLEEEAVGKPATGTAKKGESPIALKEATSGSSIRGLSRVAQDYARNKNVEESVVESVERMQSFSVSDEEVRRFLAEGGLSGGR